MIDAKNLQVMQKSFKGAHDRLVFVFEALGDPTRLRIFKLLFEGKKKDLCVTDVANVCGISVPAASYQLKILEMVGLIQRDRMGKMICYALKEKDPLVKSIMRIIQ